MPERFYSVEARNSLSHSLARPAPTPRPACRFSRLTQVWISTKQCKVDHQLPNKAFPWTSKQAIQSTSYLHWLALIGTLTTPQKIIRRWFVRNTPYTGHFGKSTRTSPLIIRLHTYSGIDGSNCDVLRDALLLKGSSNSTGNHYSRPLHSQARFRMAYVGRRYMTVADACP